MKLDAKPIKLRRYTYNETFANKIKAEIDRLIEPNFIYEIDHTKWVSPIVVVLEKNYKLKVRINLKKVNKTTIMDHYCLPIREHLLEWVVEKEAHSFLDGFLGYNQVTIHPNDQHKTIFATKFGIYV